MASAEAVRIHPRASFQAWKQTVRGSSRPWTRVDLDAAESFRGALVGVVLRQAMELTRLSRALARSNAELEAFGQTISHDLKEPLRGIVTYTQILQEDYGEGLNEQARGYLQAVGRLAERSGGMLEALFEYSRLNHVELAWGEVDLQELVEEALHLLSARLEEQRAEVRVQGPSRAWRVMACASGRSGSTSSPTRPSIRKERSGGSSWASTALGSATALSSQPQLRALPFLRERRGHRHCRAIPPGHLRAVPAAAPGAGLRRRHGGRAGHCAPAGASPWGRALGGLHAGPGRYLVLHARRGPGVTAPPKALGSSPGLIQCCCCERPAGVSGQAPCSAVYRR